MSVSLCPTFGVGYQAFTVGGLPLNLGLIYTYIAGGTTPQATYTTSAGNVQNANPIVLGADGRPPSEIWLTDSATYRFDLQDSLGNLIKTYDNIQGNNALAASILASLAATSGSSLIGFTQPGTGAIASTDQIELRSRAINAVTQYGLSTGGTASANYTALKNALTAALGRSLYIPAGNYSIDPSGGILTLGCVLFGDGRNSTILTIAGNGDLFQRSSYSVLQDISIDMTGGTYSGDACKFAGTSGYQVDRSAKISNLRSGKYALNFAADGGSQFNSFGCNYHTVAAAGTGAAVKVTGTDSAAVPRCFFGTNGDGATVWDIGGAADLFIFGGFTNSILFSSSTAINTFIQGLRIGTISGTVTIKGGGHQIMGCDFADPVVLDNTTSTVTLSGEVPSYNITDNGSGNLVYTGSTAYSPAWTGSVSNPAIVNGTLTGRYSRNGRRVSGNIDLEYGSSSTAGSGTWFFSLPLLDESASGVIQTGSGYIKNAGTQFPAIALLQPGLQKISVLAGGTFANITNSAPGAWATGDFVRIFFDYLVP